MLNGKLTLGYMPDGTGSMFPFNSVFHYARDLTKEGFDNVDAIVLWGGTDIHPSYYKQEPHRANQQQGTNPIQRDVREWKAMQYAKINNIPIIGVCRGAQFLCVFSGGSLIQHITGHTGGRDHYVTDTETGEMMLTTSCHHQMMYPWDIEHKLLAYSTDRRSITYEGNSTTVLEMAKKYHEPEVVYFPRTRGLAIQGHPEWMDSSDKFVQWCNNKVETLLLNQLVEA